MKEMTTIQEWEACLKVSEERPVFVLKHSTRCPVSAAAHERVTEYVQAAAKDVPAVYLVNVIESRPVSNAVAADLGVEHQSPQLILVKDRKALWSASHLAIGRKAIEGALQQRETVSDTIPETS